SRPACARRGVPRCTVTRPTWQPAAGARCQPLPSPGAAADALGTEPRRVFLSIGKQGVGAFRRAPQHSYVIRSIEPPEDNTLPPDTTLIHMRGPFALQDEIELLKSQRIGLIVSKNAGGSATYAKIEAARPLALPVVMIERPDKAGGIVVVTAEVSLAWLADLPAMSRSDRGAETQGSASPGRAMVGVRLDPISTSVRMSTPAGSASPRRVIRASACGVP